MDTSSKTKRLSKMQKAIIEALAWSTMDFGDCTGTCGCRWKYKVELEHKDLRISVRRTLNRKDSPSFTAAFSRSLHGLLRRGIVGGATLAWVGLNYDQSNRGDAEEIIDWAGAGRRRKDRQGFPSKVPRLYRISLTTFGWRIAREIVPASVRVCPQKANLQNTSHAA